jgi:hypothetical protein
VPWPHCRDRRAGIDAEEFERFEAAIRADYQAVSMIEHELVARLASLLWRL